MPPRHVAVIVSLAIGSVVTLGMATPVWAQRFGQRAVRFSPNVRYDGRFTFARIRYTVYRRSGWEFDYPTMERNLMLMMREVTSLRPHVTESNIHTFDDTDLLKYPIAYISEPGYWVPSETEVAGLRTYLAKGGFLIVDDFMRGEWYNFEEQIRRVLPKARIATMRTSWRSTISSTD